MKNSKKAIIQGEKKRDYVYKTVNSSGIHNGPNVYAPNNRISKCTEQNLREVKEEAEKPITTLREVNGPLSNGKKQTHRGRPRSLWTTLPARPLAGLHGASRPRTATRRAAHAHGHTPRKRDRAPEH